MLALAATAARPAPTMTQPATLRFESTGIDGGADAKGAGVGLADAVCVVLGGGGASKRTQGTVSVVSVPAESSTSAV